MQVAPDATGTGLPGQSGDARVAIGSAPHRCRRLAFVPAFHLKPPVSAQFPSPRGHGFPAAATVLYVEAGRVIRIYQPIQVPKLCKSPTSAARPAQQSNLRSGLADGHFRGHFEDFGQRVCRKGGKRCRRLRGLSGVAHPSGKARWRNLPREIPNLLQDSSLAASCRRRKILTPSNCRPSWILRQRSSGLLDALTRY